MLVLFFAACTGEDVDSGGETTDTADSAEPTGPGTLAISVKMEDDLLEDLAADGEDAISTLGFDVYNEADVVDTSGPIDGAVVLGTWSGEVDLSVDGGPTGVLYTTDPLEPQIVYVLGCLDSDHNGDCGETGDPVTFPSMNKFEVIAGTENPITMQLGLRNPT